MSIWAETYTHITCACLVDLAAFVQTPVTRAFGLWYDAPEPPNGSMPGSARIAIPESGSWEGLVVDLMSVVDAYLTL